MTGRLSPRQVDWIVFGACLALSLAVALSLLRPAHVVATPDLHVPSLLLVPFGTVPLLWRRRWPAAALGILAGAFILSLAVGPLLMLPGLLCAAYAAALYGDARTRTVAGVAAVAALGAAFLTVLITDHSRLQAPAHAALVGYGVAWILGDRTRSRRRYVTSLEERALRLEQERDEQARLAALEERGRIARELHDVVAHNVSVIAVQAGAARATSAAHPERAVETLSLIERTARTTLSELRALLGVLRRSRDAAQLRRPAPSLRYLDDLLDQARASGLHVEETVEGAVRPLEPITDLCAYRVVQEAITNALKHAPRSSVVVSLCYAPRGLVVEVTDDGPGPRAGANGGQGLIGMRERVVLLGGELTAGPGPDGGFCVVARLPLGEEDVNGPDAGVSPAADRAVKP